MSTTRFHTFSDVLESLCRDKGAWGLYLSGVFEDADELRAATGDCLDLHALVELMGHGSLYLTFATEAEMRACFGCMVGDDGPTATNPYSGPYRVYALTCSPTGETLNENT